MSIELMTEDEAKYRRAEAQLTPEKLGPLMMMQSRIKRAYLGPDERLAFVVPLDWEPQGLLQLHGLRVVYADVQRPGAMVET